MSDNAVLDALEPQLIELIPQVLAAVTPDGPICVVHMCYYESTAPEAYLDFRLVTAAERQAVFDEEGLPGMAAIWEVCEEPGESAGGFIPSDEGPASSDALKALFEQAYELVCDEDEGLPAYRDMLLRVAMALNTTDWQQVFPVTDDFVVLVSNGSMGCYRTSDSVRGCIPEPKIALLQSRGYLHDEGPYLVPIL